MKLQHTLPLFSLLATSIVINAQNTLHFDKDGKIQGTLPELVYKTTDKLNFELDDPKESFADFTKQLTDKLSAAQARLTKLKADQNSLKILNDIFGITPDDIGGVINDAKTAVAKPDGSGLAQLPAYAPIFKKGSQNYLSITTDHLTGAAPVNFEANTPSAPLTVAMSASDYELDFTLSKTDPFNQMTFDWYTKTKGDYGDRLDFSKFDQGRQQLQALVNRANSFLSIVNPQLLALKQKNAIGTLTFYRDIRDTAQKLADEINAVVTPVSKSIPQNNLKSWMLEWLWYQSAMMPAVNPFSFKDPTDLGDAPDTSALPSIRTEISARESMYQNTGMFKMGEPGLDKFIARDIALRKQLDSIQRLLTKYKNDTAKNDKQEQAFCTTKSQLYKGMLFAGTKQQKLFWMRHHDASRNYMLMNPDGAEEYLETDRVVILAHNLTATQKASIHISFAAITNDESKLAETLGPVVDSLKTAATGLAAVGAANVGGTELDKMKSSADDAIVNLQRAVKAAQNIAPDLDYLATQSNPDVKLSEKTDQSASYHSEVANPPKKTEGPKKATYYFNPSAAGATDTGAAAAKAKADAPAADTFTYRINKLYRIFPMGGVFYTTTPFSTIGVDSATKQSKVTAGARAAFIVGFKVYLEKTDIRNSSIFWKKDAHDNPLWPSRVSIDFAFDVADPLTNLYVGPALDIWPGCTINIGAIFNQYTYNAYNNGVVTDTRKLYRPGLFVGISTDLSLFTDLGKFFNLSK
jgi:hypothetical protein